MFYEHNSNVFIIKCNFSNFFLYTDRDFQKEVLYRLAFIKHELKRLVNNQMDIAQRIELIETRLDVNISNTSSSCNINTSTLNDISDCILPLDNTTDLDTFNDKISGDRAFQINLVRKSIPKPYF